MAQQDLANFIKKVKALEALVSSLDKFPTRREKLSSCSSHDQVVKLAKSWGFDIGKRWGEK